MKLQIYYSTYIIIWGFLYWLKIVKYNPLSWLIIALITSIIIILYLVCNNVPINMLIKYIILNSPKLLLLCLIDHNNINNGFIIGTIFFIYYLIIIDFDIKNVYFDQTIKKLLDSTI
jgi:hypothetical protein